MQKNLIVEPDRWTGDYNDITSELIELTETDPKLHAMLEKSIGKANDVNGNHEMNPVDDLDDYFRFVDRMSQMIPGDILKNPADPIRNQVLQGLCYFCFLIDQELPELEGEDQYNNTLQYYEPFAEWFRNFVDSWGEFLDTEESWNREICQEFYANPRFGLQEDWYESPSNWDTFNEFFARQLRTPESRPIESGESVVTSPTDSIPQGVWDIDDNSNISVGIRLKNMRHHSVDDLLSEDSDYTDAFAGGTLTHSFLNVNDYHRYHFPIGGEIVEKNKIRENIAVGVGWNESKEQYDPNTSVGWQFSQTRGCVIIDTGEYGLVALMPVGMAHVSSVEFEDDVQVGEKFDKGDLLGKFQFGGSDFVMLFQEQAGFEIDAPRKPQLGNVTGRPEYEHVKMGERYGILNG